MKKVLFIRHGESEANAGGRTHCPESIRLTAKGIEQSKQLLEKITVVPSLIITTSHIRTVQTAGLFIEKYPNVPVQTWPLHEFTFLSPILCRETTAAQRAPWVNGYWERCDPGYVHGEGAESFDHFIERVYLSLKLLSSSSHHNITVFTHGYVIRAIKMFLEHTEEDRGALMKYYRDVMLKLDVPNAHVFETTVPDVLKSF